MKLIFIIAYVFVSWKYAPNYYNFEANFCSIWLSWQKKRRLCKVKTVMSLIIWFKVKTYQKSPPIALHRTQPSLLHVFFLEAGKRLNVGWNCNLLQFSLVINWFNFLWTQLLYDLFVFNLTLYWSIWTAFPILFSFDSDSTIKPF